MTTHGKKRNALVWGAAGFVGGELLRLLCGHPHFDLRVALSNTHGDRPVAEVHPGLAPWTHLDFIKTSNWSFEHLRGDRWTVFSAQPHTISMTTLPKLLEQLKDEDVHVIDLSGDFRLEDPKVYERYYGTRHVNPALLETFVYGLPESNRHLIAESNRVACPGCLATGAQLAILPMAPHSDKVSCIALDSKTGSSGAGVLPRETTHHPRRMNNFQAYRPLVHQHTPEIIAGWTRSGGSPEIPISFAPQMAPMVRGIFTTAHIFLNGSVSREEIIGFYRAYYAPFPFVRIVDASPCVTDVWGSNRCDISIAVDDNKVLVATAIDNLIKGAAGGAIQCANIAAGFDETTGLLYPPPRPV